MLAGVCFLLSCVGANLALVWFGLVPVGFGLQAPAGVYCIGLSFTFRDLAHERLGRWAVVWMIVVAALVTATFSPRFGLASGSALLLSELADLAVYEPLRRRRWLLAVVASNLAGAVVDSALFLLLAFGSLDYLAGQLVGKLWSTVAVLPFLAWRRRAILAAGALLLTGVTADAQVIAVNGAWLHNRFASQPVAELFVSGPPVHGMRAYGIASFDLSETGSPTLLARVGYAHPIGPAMAGVGAGVISLPWDRTPRPSLSANVIVGHRRLRPYVVVAYERTPDWTLTTFVGLTTTIWFRR